MKGFKSDPDHTNAGLRISVFVSKKTKQNTKFLFLTVHTNPFLHENAFFFMRFPQPFILKSPKTVMDAAIYDAGFFRQQSVFETKKIFRLRVF